MFCCAWVTFMLDYVNFKSSCLCLKEKSKNEKWDKMTLSPMEDGGKGCLVAP